MLVHFHIAGLSIEVPARPTLKRSGDHRLRRIKFNHFAVHVDPRRTNDSVLVDSEKVSVCNHAGAVHLEFEQLLPINVLRSLNAVQHG